MEDVKLEFAYKNTGGQEVSVFSNRLAAGLEAFACSRSIKLVGEDDSSHVSSRGNSRSN